MTASVVHTRGDTLIVAMQWTTDGSAPLDLTGNTLLSQLRRAPTPTGVRGELVATFVVTVTDALTGAFSLSLTAAETAALLPGEYFFDVQRTRTVDGFVETVPRPAFRLLIVGDVTHVDP